MRVDSPDGTVNPDGWFDSAPCGLARTDDEGVFIAVNSTFCGWVEQPREALVGKRRFQDLLTMGGRIFHQTHWMPLLQMQGSISEVKLEIRLAQGSPLPMVVNALRTEREGVMLHELATFVARDRDKYERELLVARRRLEELVSEATRLQAETKDRALLAEQMIGIVSHDLRNPLSTISMRGGTSHARFALRPRPAHPGAHPARERPRRPAHFRSAGLHAGARRKRFADRARARGRARRRRRRGGRALPSPSEPKPRS
jgi:signal transduction histidine kinase